MVPLDPPELLTHLYVEVLELLPSLFLYLPLLQNELLEVLESAVDSSYLLLE